MARLRGHGALQCHICHERQEFLTLVAEPESLRNVSWPSDCLLPAAVVVVSCLLPPACCQPHSRIRRYQTEGLIEIYFQQHV